jgi:cytochrome d ubiquinol oxidase subunit II
MDEAIWLPIVFVGLMGLAVLVYAILDGYDLGVGILLPFSTKYAKDRDMMIASIGPFWDANETWLVLAVGIMLIAFPAAHSIVLLHLYLPATLMLIGLILRGVAFDFRTKAGLNHKATWDHCFRFGSILTSLAQGYMLGQYVVGFQQDAISIGFSILSALCVTAAYAYIGACWLVYKTEGELQTHSAHRARLLGRIAFMGILSVCMVNPWTNPDVYQRWFLGEYHLILWALPSLCIIAFIANDRLLKNVPMRKQSWLPFIYAITLFTGCFLALGVSFYPAIVPNKIDIWEAASATASLKFILVGVIIVVPFILAYTIYSYWVFRGKASDLHYH